MTSPRGGQYKLILPDGTKVWLNAASSITYPTIFAEDRRVVSITGEVYFEVTKNARKPFTVRTYSDEITVLGTSFNVNSYTDEAMVKTSLLEGSVRINKQVLKPGEAYINGKIMSTSLEQDLAWKNGFFSFNKADLPTVMRQLSRWYNVDVKYEGVIPKRAYSGEIERSLTLRQVLEVLSQTRIKYKIEQGNVITILN
jgi:ferric-dicitrate binding protein FerR (iron transport regulator)